MSEQNQDWTKDFLGVMQKANKPIIERLQALEQALGTVPPSSNSSTPPPKTETHKTLAEQLLCKDCNPPEAYREAHLKLMGQKECKECHHIDRANAEWCSDCGESYES